jgi:para-aminobenzoate synthetase/4-amino-4-deoxychorismate lyase
VAEVGTVKVPALFEVERHPTLWQMTSTVTANCLKSVSEIMAALFPCASITGAPKVRTSQIITELEPDRRGIYTGCIGFIAPNRSAQFNVAIRTAVVDRQSGQAEYGSGGGIVWDSASSDEYSEALLKARVLTEKFSEFSLLETLLWTPVEEFFLLDRHLKRLADSASYFSYTVDIPKITKRLFEEASGFGRGPQRVRLLVDSGGDVDIQADPLTTGETLQLVRVRLAAEPVNSTDVFLYHKTTRRQVYEAARQSRPDCDDVLLWNEHGELTESCIANVVVEIDGILYTPPVFSGLLAGTFRAWLLEQGRIRERVIQVGELKRCKKIFLINSVRRWQEALLL